MGKGSEFKNRRNQPKSGIGKRKQDTRPELEPVGSDRKVVFSLRDFDETQIPPGQSFEDWESKGLLSKLMHSLHEISKVTIVEALQRKLIKKYDSFPTNTDFKKPAPLSAVTWGTIQKISGFSRVAGHIAGNVFYIVFLDENHRFWISEKKHT